jgi:hypothetical protein
MPSNSDIEKALMDRESPETYGAMGERMAAGDGKNSAECSTGVEGQAAKGKGKGQK